MTVPVGDLNHVGIMVRDLDQAEAFATRVLGLPIVNRIAAPEHGMRAIFVSCGTGLIEFVEFSDPELLGRRLGDQVATIDHIALSVADLDGTVLALAEHGVETASPEPVVLPSGRIHFTKADSSGGIIWQLIEPGPPGETQTGETSDVRS
jgi:methylmalonyl-CoA/ethylmalonyl-CoA epimerase